MRPKYVNRGCMDEAEWLSMKVVFWVFFSGVALLLALIAVTGFLFAHSPMDMVMIHLFLYSCLWASAGGLVGGYLGAMMEEDSCGALDMGVLSSMGSLLANLVLPLGGAALAGLSLFFPWTYLWGATLLLFGVLFVVMNRMEIAVERRYAVDACGWRVDAQGARLPLAAQPLRMKNLLAIALGIAVGVYSILTVYMAVKMKYELWGGTMIGAMMYAMGGACLGGMASGWLGGMLDWHSGAAEHDNPIMVAGMSLMTGMMGGMLAAMAGGMMAVMGAGAIVATLAAALVLAVACWGLFIARRYRLRLHARVKLPPPPAEDVGDSASCC